jgi:DNA-binding transcriptional LysR family regulator
MKIITDISKMNINSIDLNLLNLFDALLKEGSVTRAGQRLGLSQPAASRGLARLRRLLNDQLLIRTTNGWELTPRATALSAPVAKLLDDARSIVAPSVFNPSTASGQFTIATGDHMALMLLPALISKLVTLAPGIDLVIPTSSGDNVDFITQGESDLAIGVFQNLPARFYQRALYDEDFVCVVRDNHPEVSDKLTVKNFVSLSHLAVIITGKGKSPIDDALAKQGLTRRVTMQIPHFLAAPMIVAESDLILSIPRKLAYKMSQSVPIKILELPIEIATFTPSMIWHERQHNDPRHIWLRNLIMEISSNL